MPVIFVTARAGVEAHVESLQAGADDYLCKPFNEEELLARIKNQLRLHEQERALEALNAKLRELDRRMSEFVSIVAHELRTPMTAIAGFAENMLEGLGGTLSEKHRSYVQRLKVNTDRITRMVTELLDLSRIEADTMELRFEAIALREFVANVVDGFQGMSQERGVTIHAGHIPDSMRVQGDMDKLTQIVKNLVRNAMKFTSSGGEIRIDAEEHGNECIQVCVADTCCGIQASELSRIFDRFHREGSVSPEGRGTGLGLAIVKHLVELHRGRIWVESAHGLGSPFYFTLPLVPQGP